MKIKIIILTFLITLLNFNINSQETNLDIIELNKLLETGVITQNEYHKLKEIVIDKDYKKNIKTTNQSNNLEETWFSISSNTKKKIEKVKKIQSNIFYVKKRSKNFINISVKSKKNEKITGEEIFALGVYNNSINYPKKMKDEFNQCTAAICIERKASQKVYQKFVRRSELWHTRYPGDIIKGMAWFEIFFNSKLKKQEESINKFLENGPESFKSSKLEKFIKEVHSLIKMNKGRKKMRQALGLDLEDNLSKVLERQWLFAEFLNKDTLKAIKVKENPEFTKRGKLIKKYITTLKKYNEKLSDKKKVVN